MRPRSSGPLLFGPAPLAMFSVAPHRVFIEDHVLAPGCVQGPRALGQREGAGRRLRGSSRQVLGACGWTAPPRLRASRRGARTPRFQAELRSAAKGSGQGASLARLCPDPAAPFLRNRSHKAGGAEAPGGAEAEGHGGGGGPAAPEGRPSRAAGAGGRRPAAARPTVSVASGCPAASPRRDCCPPGSLCSPWAAASVEGQGHPGWLEGARVGCDHGLSQRTDGKGGRLPLLAQLPGCHHLLCCPGNRSSSPWVPPSGGRIWGPRPPFHSQGDGTCSGPWAAEVGGGPSLAWGGRAQNAGPDEEWPPELRCGDRTRAWDANSIPGS